MFLRFPGQSPLFIFLHRYKGCCSCTVLLPAYGSTHSFFMLHCRFTLKAVQQTTHILFHSIISILWLLCIVSIDTHIYIIDTEYLFCNYFFTCRLLFRNQNPGKPTGTLTEPRYGKGGRRVTVDFHRRTAIRFCLYHHLCLRYRHH